MNKRNIITILLALVAMAGQAQEIKKVAATPEDFMERSTWPCVATRFTPTTFPLCATPCRASPSSSASITSRG